MEITEKVEKVLWAIENQVREIDRTLGCLGAIMFVGVGSIIYAAITISEAIKGVYK